MVATRLLIVGGGIHGTFFARALTQEAGFAADDLIVLDPWNKPAQAWRRRCHTVGMTHLRSTSSHNMGTDFRSLRRWAAERGYDPEVHFREPYARPSLEVFHAHLDHLIDTTGIDARYRTGTAQRLRRNGRSWMVDTETETIAAESVLLATGPGKPKLPAWAHRPQIRHVYDADIEDAEADDRNIAVIGGGISAWQYACRRSVRNTVTVLSPHEIRRSMFDSDPGYMGPKKLRGFLQKTVPDRETELIDARRPGSIPPDLETKVRARIADKSLRFLVCNIRSMVSDTSGITLTTTASATLGPFDEVICATGFCGQHAADSLIASTAVDAGFPCSDSGYPLLQPDLSWSEGLYVSGGAAALTLGPTAGNIIGAHKAFAMLRDTLT